MIELPLSAEAEAYGRDRKRVHDADGVTDTFKVPGYDKRWTGHAVEYELHQLFTQKGIPHVWNGGLDDKPDFDIGGIGIAAKSNSGPGPNPEFEFVIPKNHVNKLADQILFSIVQIRDRKVWVAGVLHSSLFRQLTTRKSKGDPGFAPGRPIAHDCYVVSASTLGSAEAWLRMMQATKGDS